MSENKKSFFYYMNPILWLKKIFSYLLSFLLFLNHFFVLLLLIIIAVLFVLFGYDRYAARTYVKDTTSKFSSGSFANYSAYNSPLTQGNKDLSSDLSSYYEREVREKKKEQEAQKVEVEDVSQATDVVDQKPIWNEEKPARLSIQDEVNKRLGNIKESVKNRQK